MSQLASRPHGMEARIRFRVLASLALLTGLAVVGIAFARPASAHAVLVSSSPQDGARVNTQPAAVELRFDEVIEPISAAEQVISTTGARADTGKVAIIDGGRVIAHGAPEELCRGGAEDTLRFTGRPGLDLASLLNALPADSKATELSPGTYRIEGKVDPQMLATVTSWCAQHGVMPDRIAVERRTLEDVFLELTGKELRA